MTDHTARCPGLGSQRPGGVTMVLIAYFDMSIQLFCGECLDVMRGIPDASVDAVVTDPPFGIGFDYSGKREITNQPADYWEWLRPKYKEALRCLRPGGFVAVWQTQLYFRHFWDWFGSDIHIYAACKNFVQIRKTPINYGYDPVVMRYKPGNVPLRPTKPPRSVDFFVANTASIVSDPKRIEKAHPCPRPLDQVQQILTNFVRPGGRILDPFAGSGTGLVASIRGGYEAIGIEINPVYHALAERRIAAELHKTPLFIA
jgi:adenine-specific DNA-methyltransferase